MWSVFIELYWCFLCVLMSFIRFELLEVLTFDSVRRRMSVIVRSSTGNTLHTLNINVQRWVDVCVFSHTHFPLFSFCLCVCLCVCVWAQVNTICSVKVPTPPSSPGSYQARWSKSKLGWSTMQWWEHTHTLKLKHTQLLLFSHRSHYKKQRVSFSRSIIPMIHLVRLFFERRMTSVVSTVTAHGHSGFHGYHRKSISGAWPTSTKQFFCIFP